jgi:hypothetical protein
MRPLGRASVTGAIDRSMVVMMLAGALSGSLGRVWCFRNSRTVRRDMFAATPPDADRAAAMEANF